MLAATVRTLANAEPACVVETAANSFVALKSCEYGVPMVVGSCVQPDGERLTLNASKVTSYVELTGTAAREAASTTSQTPSVGPVVITRVTVAGPVVKPMAWLAAVSGTPNGCSGVAFTRPLRTFRVMRIAVVPVGTSKNAFGCPASKRNALPATVAL